MLCSVHADRGFRIRHLSKCEGLTNRLWHATPCTSPFGDAELYIYIYVCIYIYYIYNYIYIVFILCCSPTESPNHFMQVLVAHRAKLHKQTWCHQEPIMVSLSQSILSILHIVVIICESCIAKIAEFIFFWRDLRCLTTIAVH